MAEKDVALGSLGKLALTLSNGTASISITAGGNLENGDVQFSSVNSVSISVEDFAKILAAEIIAKSPVGIQPIEQGAESILLGLLSSVK